MRIYLSGIFFHPCIWIETDFALDLLVGKERRLKYSPFSFRLHASSCCTEYVQDLRRVRGVAQRHPRLHYYRTILPAIKLRTEANGGGNKGSANT